MTFGEHLEVLRVHVWRALIGLIIGVVAALFFGDTVIKILKEPIDDALHRANMPEAEDDLGGMDFQEFLKQLFSDEEPPEAEPAVEEPLAEDELEVEFSITELKKLVEDIAPGTIKDPPETSPEETTTTADNSDEATDSDQTVDEPTGKLVLKSPDFEMFKKTVKRFEKPVTYKVEEAFMTYIKVSMVAGLVLTSPWVFYQIWQFVAAGLYPHERKYVHVYLPMSIGLFVLGAVFCFYFVFPIVLDFLISFNKWLGIEIQPRLSEYISLVLMLPVMFGISFQLPLIMLFLERIGIMSVDGYKQNWRMAVLIIAIASMLLTPSDPTSMMLMMVPLVFLYFGGILLCKFKPNAADPLA